MENFSVVDKNPITSLINNEIDILIHSVTCQGNLAIGIARHIGITFPEAEKVNWKICRSYNKNKRALLGSFSFATGHINNKKYAIVNLYGQVEPGPLFETSQGKEALKKALLNFGTTKKSGLPIKYGITLIGTEFNSISEEKSEELIKNVLEELKYGKELDFNLTIYRHET